MGEGINAKAGTVLASRPSRVHRKRWWRHFAKGKWCSMQTHLGGPHTAHQSAERHWFWVLRASTFANKKGPVDDEC